MKETELTLKPIGFNNWELTTDFKQIIDDKEILIPKGFQTDLASVPRIFWAMFPPFSCPQPSVVHDFLYTQNINSKERDQIFYDLMIRYGMYQWKAKIMWGAVRIYSILIDKR